MKTIKQVSAETGLSIDTLRYYERIGLIDDIQRNTSGHRCYNEDNIDWISLLLCLRETGMSIADMQRFAELVRGSQSTIPARLDLLQTHKQSVLERITQMHEKLKAIDRKIAIYTARQGETV